MSEMVKRVMEAQDTERKRWIFWTNLEELRYEAWRWNDDLSAKEIHPLGCYPGGVKASAKFGEFVSRAIARAGIEAMREPTQDMIEACGADDYYDSFDRRKANWETMIDAALAE